MEPVGRARGRSRGRGRGEDVTSQVRRPGEADAGASPAVAGPGAQGVGVPQLVPGFQQLSVGPSGRATAGIREVPGESVRPVGRASTGFRGTVPSTATVTAPLTAEKPAISAGETVAARPSAGRGASRGREAREPTIVTRPSPEFTKRGNYGAPIAIGANYFELLQRPDIHLLQYRVDFLPDIDHIGVRKSLLRNHEAALGKYLFDGTLLYNITRLPQPFEVYSKRVSDGTDVKITLRLVGEIQKHDSMYTNVMNIIIRRCLGMLKLVQVKRDYFDNQAAQEIPQHQLTIWPGYLTTIRFHESGYLLGVEIIHKVLRRDTALDVMNRIQRGGRDIEANVRAALLGAVVMTRYNNKTYRIDDIDFNKNPLSTFHLRKEDRDISYMEYYSTRYQAIIRSDTQPLLVSRPTRRDVNRGDTEPIYLIPELCGMTGLSDDQRTNFNLMKDVAGITRVAPDRRVDSLMRFRKRLQEHPDIKKELDSWGLRFSEQIVQIPARTIPYLEVAQGNNSYRAEEGDWSRNLHRSPMAATANLARWLIILPVQMSADVKSFVEQLIKVGRAQHFNIPDPKVATLPMDRTNNYLDAIESNDGCLDFNMVMCVLRAQRKDTYAAIKKKLCVQQGVSSQVITGRILKGPPNKVMSVATKVMIQIASKLGAEPWRITSLPKASWMVIGYDTYHDARQRKAVGAFVASLNQHFTKYYSSVKIHENNEEISPSFKDHLLGSLKAYYQENRKLPENVIVFRDGVGAGDIARIKETEIASLKSACMDAEKRVNTPNPVKLTFIVVNKRINARFFAMGPRGPTNPPCGTVVDDVVTLQERYDFFLVSQKVTQGTVSPTSYHVIEDTQGFKPDILQRLSYALTHLYYNWPGTLRVPAPIQYAHKLAYLVGESIMGVPHVNLSKNLYYL